MRYIVRGLTRAWLLGSANYRQKPKPNVRREGMRKHAVVLIALALVPLHVVGCTAGEVSPEDYDYAECVGDINVRCEDLMYRLAEVFEGGLEGACDDWESTDLEERMSGLIREHEECRTPRDACLLHIEDLIRQYLGHGHLAFQSVDRFCDTGDIAHLEDARSYVDMYVSTYEEAGKKLERRCR